MSTTACAIFQDLTHIRARAPLIHNITNLVVMQQTANALLALGASPIMAHAPEELADILAICQALVINIGTLDESWIASMKQAISLAEQKNIPIIFDPVGAGASRYRTAVAKQLLELGPMAIIRGNAGEILALAGVQIQSKGVDSTYASQSACEAAKQLQERFGAVVVISGQTDYIIEPGLSHCIGNGVSLMSKVTGMGCSASALCAAFAAVNTNFAQAAVHAMAVMGIAGEIAFQATPAPGSFAIKWLDAIYQMTAVEVTAKLNYSVLSVV